MEKDSLGNGWQSEGVCGFGVRVQVYILRPAGLIITSHGLISTDIYSLVDISKNQNMSIENHSYDPLKMTII